MTSPLLAADGRGFRIAGEGGRAEGEVAQGDGLNGGHSTKTCVRSIMRAR